MGGRNTCSIPGCRSVRKRQRTDNDTKVSLFMVPKNADLFEKWQKAIAYENFELTHKDRVCNLHFKKEEFEQYYTTLLPDGTVNKIERGRIKINPQAVPSIFNFDTELHETKRKFPTPQIPDTSSPPILAISSAPTATPIPAISSTPILTTSSTPTATPIAAISSISILTTSRTPTATPIAAISSAPTATPIAAISSTPILTTSSTPTATPIAAISSISILTTSRTSTATPIAAISSAPTATSITATSRPTMQDSSQISENLDWYTEDKPYSFEDLIKELFDIFIPNDLWGVTKTSSFVIFARFDEHYTLLKKVVVEHNLNVKIFLREQEVNLAGSKKISCINDLINLLDIVEKIKICAGATDKSMRNCSIYLEKKHKGPEKTWCTKCVTTRKKNNAKMKNKKTILVSYILQKNLLKNTKRKK